MGQGFGIDIRSSRVNSTSQCRQRGDAVVRGEIVMLDLAGSDALTSAYTEGTKGSVGTQSTASSPLATVLPATTGLTAGRVGVAIAAVADNQLGRYEFGEHGDGSVTDVIVEALVKVGAANVEGAALRVGTITLSDALGGVTAVLDAAADGGTFATLLEDATTDDKGGPATTANYKRVILHSAGKADASGDETEEQKRIRFAATSGLGASSTTGAFASFTWDPGQDVTVSLVYATAVAPSATVTVFGAAAASSWNARFLTTGEVEFREATTQRAITAAGVALYDGLPHTLSLRVTGTTVAITHDGIAVGSGTFSSVTWGSTTYFIGAGAASSSQRFPGTIYNVTGVDAAGAANSFTYLMDEPSGNFVNTYSGSSVGNATRNGFVPMTAVVSTDGRGMPWQSQGPLVYSLQATGTQSGVAGTVRIALTGTEILDPTSSFTGSVWTAPAAGTVVVTATVTAFRTAGADEILLFQIRKASTTAQGPSANETITTNRALIAVTRSFSVAAAETVDFFVTGFVGSTISMDNAYMSIEFYPTPVAG